MRYRDISLLRPETCGNDCTIGRKLHNLASQRLGHVHIVGAIHSHAFHSILAHVVGLVGRVRDATHLDHLDLHRLEADIRARLAETPEQRVEDSA